MRGWIRSVVLLIVVLAGPAAPADVDRNWVLARVVTGPSGTGNIFIEIAGSATLTGTGPAVFGSGLAFPGNGLFFVQNLGGDGLSVTTSRDFGGHRVRVTPSTGDAYTFRVSATLNLSFGPAETVVLVVLAPNATIGNLDVSATAVAGDVSLVTLDGTGATAMPLVDPDRDGMSAAAGPAGFAAASEYSAAPAAGIVGAFTTQDCEGPCAAHWQGPDGSGDWIGVGAHAYYGGTANPLGRYTFTGPAGDWSWRWTGAMLTEHGFPIWLFGSPVVGAWAPIGDDWIWFEPWLT